MSYLPRLQVLCLSVVAALFLLLASAVSVWAQNPRGSLQGEVQDATGARIAAAAITISAAQISVERTARTNSQGEFRIDDLTPGTTTS